MKIALLSDIHGNSWALEAVLNDINKRGITEIYDAGDSLYGPLDPKGTFELLKTNSVKSLRGNQDRNILEHLDKRPDNQTMKYVLSELTDEIIEWLLDLPRFRQIEDKVHLFHGTPKKDTEYLLEQLNPAYVGIKDFSELDNILSRVNEKIVVCGHSHCAGIVDTGNKLIINPGSVGLPAYDDEMPIFHKMESFNSNTRYCILEIEDSVKIQQITLSYDKESAAKCAEKNDRHDWAEWIRKGVA